MSTSATYALSLLQSCMERKDLVLGRKLHVFIITNNFDGVVLLQDQLIRVFASCGSLIEASLLFCNSSSPSSCTWQAIISGHVSAGESEKALELYQKMQEEGLRASKYIYTCLLKACGLINASVQGDYLHNDIIRNGSHGEVTVGNALIDMYTKCGRLEEALKVFDCLSEKDVVSWNVVIAGSSQLGNGILAINLFSKMQQTGACPDMITYLGVSKACGCMNALQNGKRVHSQVGNAGIEMDIVLGSCLVDMYGKCGSIELAQEVFNALPKRNIVSWNGLIGGYVQQEVNFDAVELLQKMKDDNLEPNFITFLCLLKACSNLGSLVQGEMLHALVLKKGLDFTEAVGNALVDMYSKCGNLVLAQRVFDELPSRNVVSWCALLSGYSENGLVLHALEIFERMQEESVKPDRVMFVCALKACSSIGNTIFGNQIYGLIVESDLEQDFMIGNALLDLYAKCGRLEEAHKIFNQLRNIDVVSCNTMIFTYLENERGFDTLEILELMQSRGMKADKVTLLSCAMACGSIGAFEQGKLIHELIVRDAFESDILVGTTLVDMYSKFGSLDEASNVFNRLANPNVVSWTALIVGYAQQGKISDALKCMKELEKRGLQPDGKIYVTLFMACSHACHVDEGFQHFENMINHGIVPTVEHVNCLSELLSRSGCLKEAEKILQSMPASGDVAGWVSLLTACKAYGDRQLGTASFDQAVKV
ncbi:hypothetical protein GOP47_0017060 [Adiantum capillus-veneris]|uniref:Pentatricopeptide repeat-containing protein n=1 Tax=Adiantum capillus-veneris TaxID=13818 RepID=A0A9D4UIZ3_ADICA|nr:hypothetical protein GOP47_0017060 [Adiantum capillus-veneris]